MFVHKRKLKFLALKTKFTILIPKVTTSFIGNAFVKQEQNEINNKKLLDLSKNS